ncbi:hypothetical protein Sango_3061900 [Sesamum angolense]|uniref:Reverse transcriptase zinc-binding domain-containing protein n=1 Tax=Sesamum angolense TaxID=2727404 RepID=A0AAE1TBP4_9LAMI|nr:hypothetical protein Sango_3061900 [Sesamum angolense]
MANLQRVRSNLLRNWSRELWTALQTISVTSCEEPWIVLGDFNAIIDASEACGRAADTTASMNDFRNCILETGLIHIPFTGCPYTWHICSEGIRSLWKRLDRILVNATWLEVWPNSSYICALPSTSDHSPLILNAANGGISHSLFRFDNFLAKQPGFLESQRKLKGDLTDNVRLAKGFLDKAQELFAAHRADFVLQLVKSCRFVYSVAIKLESSMLCKRAKLQWLKHGDQNSRIFFRKINAIRARQRVFQIMKANGEVLTDMNEVAEEFVSCFKTLLGGTRSQWDINLCFLQQGVKQTLTQEEAELISAPVTHTEVQEAIFDIDEDSAPGPDGYTSAFFKAAWPVVGEEICEAVREFFRTGKLLKQISATLLVLIPKVQMPSQNAFVPGCSIFDNILLAQELLAGYNQAKLPPRCTIKVDLKKAYDSVEWDFLTEGDPMSPYLFVLVMEIWNTLLRYRVHNASQFQHHWKCKDLNILNICFVDDDELSSSNQSYGALHAYWASVFILPKGIIKIIEARIQKFLWQGSTGRGYAKVAWEQVCKLKEEGGLGIRSIIVMNQALMLKHLWKLVQMDRSSIWDDWILQYRLRNSTIWSFTGATGSWGWKKMLKLRPILKSGLIYKVGNGDSFKLWKDIWHEHGPLCLSYPRGPTTTGLSIDASLSCVLLNGQWHWFSQTDPDISNIVASLPLIYPNEPDSITWRISSGKFTVQSAISLIRPPAPLVKWHVLLHGRYKIAKHYFILWLAILEKLSTTDKPWITHEVDGCVLCDGHFDETHTHLFFNCHYSKRCLAILHSKVQFQWPYLGWQQGIT